MLTRSDYINHVMHMRTLDPSYAEKAHRWYCAMLPWLDLPRWDALKAPNA